MRASTFLIVQYGNTDIFPTIPGTCYLLPGHLLNLLKEVTTSVPIAIPNKLHKPLFFVFLLFVFIWVFYILFMSLCHV